MRCRWYVERNAMSVVCRMAFFLVFVIWSDNQAAASRASTWIIANKLVIYDALNILHGDAAKSGHKCTSNNIFSLVKTSALCESWFIKVNAIYPKIKRSSGYMDCKQNQYMFFKGNLECILEKTN
jgi:hypothetical protein